MKLGLFGNTLSHWNEFDEVANQMFKQFCAPVGMKARSQIECNYNRKRLEC